MTVVRLQKSCHCFFFCIYSQYPSSYSKKKSYLCSLFDKIKKNLNTYKSKRKFDREIYRFGRH